MFNQTFEFADMPTIAILVLLEGVLSIDNALVLGLLAKRLPHHQQKRALTYGLVGAFVFRVVAIVLAALLMQIKWVKLLGGGYLIWVAVKHFFFDKHKHHGPLDAAGNPTLPRHAGFWATVMVIELTDIAFAIDSILAAIALVEGHDPAGAGHHPKMWVVIAGGMIGVVLMRFAAMVFMRLLEKFPRFEITAYLLVMIIGMKLVVDYLAETMDLTNIDFHHANNPGFWIFWTLMALCTAIGFLPKKKGKKSIPVPHL